MRTRSFCCCFIDTSYATIIILLPINIDAFLMLYMKILRNTGGQAMQSLVMFRISTQEVHNICCEILLKKCKFYIYFDKCISSISV